MSEKPQRKTGVSKEDVSRETPVDMLNKIMDRTMPHTPEELGKDIKEEPPGQEAEPSGPEEDAHPPAEKNKPSSVYIYLAVLFGAAFLMLLLAYFVQQRNNATVLDDLRTTTASREELLEDIQKLEKEKNQLQEEVASQKEQVFQKSQHADDLQKYLEQVTTTLDEKDHQLQALGYLWYLSQFMDSKDYPMAAAAVVLSMEPYQNEYEKNPAQIEQYQAYCQELTGRGYLQEVPKLFTEAPPLDSQEPSTTFTFADRWNPSQNDDMAALSVLWLALGAHFVGGAGYDNAASQYLYHYPLANPESGYQDRVERLAGNFTLRQFQRLKDDLLELKAIAIDDQGVIICGSWAHTDELYTLPFELPEGGAHWVYSPSEGKVVYKE